MQDRSITLGLLHLAPTTGDLVGNRGLIERATTLAAGAGCDWVVSGELIESGYDFVPTLGTDWVPARPDPWLASYAALAAELGVCAFLDVPDRDAAGATRSSLIAIDRSGEIAGRHAKIAVIPGAESWAIPGEDAVPVEVDGARVGLLVCADAHPPGIADLLAERGVDLFVSAAAWTPGFHGPDGEWEAISARTGRPVVVVNRGGVCGPRDFSEAPTVVAIGGERVVEVAGATSTVFVVRLTWRGDAATAELTARIDA